MNRSLLLIRWWQIRKELKGAGLLYALLLLLIVVAGSGMAFSHYRRNPDAYLVAGLIAGSVLALHTGRKDKSFVRKHMDRPVFNMFLEYSVLTLPFTLPVLGTPYAWLFVLMQLAFAGIACIPGTLREKTRYRFLASWIAARDFEWLSGVRKSFMLLIAFYTMAWATCWIMVAPLVALWLITVQAASFYAECESVLMLRSGYTSAVSLLHTKIKRHSRMLLLLSLPVLMVNSFFCPGMLWINLAFAGVQLLLLVFAILLKYAVYIPEKTLSGNNILLGIASLSVAVPFLLPVPLLMNIRNYGRAVRNLKTYLP